MEKLRKANGLHNDVQYLFYCTGCETVHGFNSTWKFNENMESPTVTPSLLTRGNNEICHLYITDGKLVYLSDCTHKLKGQTIEIPEFPF